jgi:hypothetical protein
MSKKHKILLPFALYEELENMDQLNPEEMKAFLVSLRRYCDSTGKEFNKICKDLDLEEPTWSGKLTPRQIETLDQACKNPHTYSSSYKDSTWSIDPETGLVDVVGNFYAYRSSFITNSKSLMGIKFGRVEGDFAVSGCNLTSMEGFPAEITGSLLAERNKFEDLKGCPQKIGKNLSLNNNSNLKNLVGSPDEIGGSLNLEGCRSLDSLEGSPIKIGGNMNCQSTSIKDLKGAPKEIGVNESRTYFSADSCPNLVSLEGAPILKPQNQELNNAYGKDYNFRNCSNLYSLEGLPLDQNYNISLEKNGLKPNVLRRALENAKSTGSWIVAYLTMFTDPDFIKTGKAPKDPIREKLSPSNIKKEIEENGERFVVGLKSIWNDFRVKKILKEIEIPEDTKADADLLSALDDVGL